MKKFLSILTVIFLSAHIVSAVEYSSISYPNLKEEAKLKIDNYTWSNKVKRADKDYYIKMISEGSGSYSEFYKSTGEYAFTTGCQYEFLKDGKLFGYSNQDLKFYEFTLDDNILNKRELTQDEIQELFPDFKIIKISEFSPNTNSLKIKKSIKNLKLIVLNDTDRNFYHYSFTSGNAKFELYPLSGFINIKKRGMIQFSHFGDNTKNNPWFVILVR